MSTSAKKPLSLDINMVECRDALATRVARLVARDWIANQRAKAASSKHRDKPSSPDTPSDTK